MIVCIRCFVPFIWYTWIENEFNSILNVRDDVFSEGDGVSCESADDTEEDRRENLRKRGRRTDF